MAEPGNVPPGLEEQIQHAFHLRLQEPTPDDEGMGGEVRRRRGRTPLRVAVGLVERRP
jgi:hypothetical protein